MTKVSVLKTTFAFVALILLAAGPISLAPLGHSAKNSSVSEARRGQRRSPRVLVKKARRELLLYSNDKLIRTYHIGLGLSPLGDKVRAGDRRTPEGNFYIFTKNDKSAFYLSLGLSYPNIAHAERGLRDGLISRSQYETIVRAVKAGKAPPQNTRLGGDIYIHGNGAQSDWTWGCVALENDDIRELFAALSLGTPVVIEP
jgi:murein L,D-transpeptidase YafK